MFTHMLNPRAGKYVLLQNMQLKRLNGIFSLDVSDAYTPYNYGPMLFPSYSEAYRTCTHIIIDMIKIQSLRKVTVVWPMLLSLGTSDGWTFQELVKARGNYHEALRLLMSYVVVVEDGHLVVEDGLDKQMCPIGLPVCEAADTYLEDALRAELTLPNHTYKTNFLGALKALNQAKEEAGTCRS